MRPFFGVAVLTSADGFASGGVLPGCSSSSPSSSSEDDASASSACTMSGRLMAATKSAINWRVADGSGVVDAALGDSEPHV